MLGALSLIRMTIASSVEPRLCGLFPACKSADYSIRYGDAAVFGAQAVPLYSKLRTGPLDKGPEQG